MDRQRVIEILESHRPGQDMESDPEVRLALDMAARDPQLQQRQREIREFDDAFAAAMGRIRAPAGLREAILQAGAARGLTGSAPDQAGRAGRRVLHWFHPATFAVAAAIIILLALSFTFRERPGAAPVPEMNTSMAMAVPQDRLSAIAHTVYASLKPGFRSHDGFEIARYLHSQGAVLPASLPEGITWDKSFACDVVEVDGVRVSIICFKAPDGSGSMHLFTFDRSAFPDAEVQSQPQVCPSGKACCHSGSTCCAKWCDGERIMVLYSDKGEENLRAVLRI